MHRRMRLSNLSIHHVSLSNILKLPPFLSISVELSLFYPNWPAHSLNFWVHYSRTSAYFWYKRHLHTLFLLSSPWLFPHIKSILILVEGLAFCLLWKYNFIVKKTLALILYTGTLSMNLLMFASVRIASFHAWAFL